MGLKVKRIYFILIVNCLVIQVSIQTQPVKRYVVTGVPPSSSGLTKSPINLGSQNAISTPNIVSLSGLANLIATASSLDHASPILATNQKVSPIPNMSSLSALANLLTAGTQTSQHASPMFATNQNTVPETKASLSVDMELLNNMAIALQLMILNTMLNSSPSEAASPEPVVAPVIPAYETKEPVTPVSVSYAPVTSTYSQPAPTTTPAPPVQTQPYYTKNTYESHQPYSMPNSNFLGSSGFADVNPIVSAISPNTGMSTMNGRTGLTLMSPYEALSPSSPYSDPFSSYGSPKMDFQSPYMSILQSDNNMDLFSI
ncbi:DNA-directed RNA polymerase II subunit RPB1-like [Achroia grisella]|uniref:DNA-directed RNA polymerase II subunit RPB1-like n=1 Tax=Achroia grisella TaxID=688607 RepID=UPI0027D31EF5|nr:DNA-directed RNA polymerase II subunit RPB1-like [Achroia grisella]